jgi:hypothetical protein
MLVYNVTVKVNTDIHEEWLEWMKKTHVPEVLATGFFSKSRISKIDIQEDDGVTYAIQYDCFSIKSLNKYMSLYAPALQRKTLDRYTNQFVAFRTVLHVIEEIFPVHTKS